MLTAATCCFTGMTESLSDRRMVESMAKQFIDALYTV